MKKVKYALLIVSAICLIGYAAQKMSSQEDETNVQAPPALIDLEALVDAQDGPTNIVVIGDSYSQNSARWTRPTAVSLTESLGRAAGGWAGYGFYRASDTAFEGRQQPAGTDMSAMGDNWTEYYGRWKSPYKQSVCADLSGASTDTIGATLVRNVRNLEDQSNLVVSYVAHQGASVFVRTDDNAGAIIPLTGQEGSLGTFKVPLKITTKQITIAALQQTVQLCGDVIEGAKSGVRMHKIAASGSRVGDWVEVPHNIQIQSFKTLEPTLYILMLGTNSHHANIPPQDWSNDMRELLSRMEIAAPKAPVLIVMPPQNMLSDRQYTIADYTDEAQTIATEKSLALLDLQPLFGSRPDDYSAESANPLFAPDGIHPSLELGGPLMVKAILEALGK